LASEGGGSAATIRDLGLPLPLFFSYPHGEFDQRVTAAVPAGEFRATFTVHFCASKGRVASERS
jgi:hypothetical protein